MGTSEKGQSRTGTSKTQKQSGKGTSEQGRFCKGKIYKISSEQEIVKKTFLKDNVKQKRKSKQR